MRLYFTLFIMLFNIHESISQWNVQVGNEFGVSKVAYTSTPLGEDIQNNRLYRTSIIGEFHVKNGLLLSINGGFGWHIVNYEYVIESDFSGEPTINSRDFKGTIQNYRVGISFGYLFNLNERSQLALKLNYNQFVVNRISIRESNYTIYSNSEYNNQPEILVEEYDPLIDTEEIGYKNKLKKENRSLSLDLSFRQQIKSFFVAPSISYSFYDMVMWSNPSLIAKANHNYLIGISLGYIFPQKSGKNEK